MKRKTVWVLHRRQLKSTTYEITSKNSWQKDVAYLNMSKKRNAKLGVPQPQLVLTYLAESTDKETLLTMLRLLQNE